MHLIYVAFAIVLWSSDLCGALPVNRFGTNRQFTVHQISDSILDDSGDHTIDNNFIDGHQHEQQGKDKSKEQLMKQLDENTSLVVDENYKPPPSGLAKFRVNVQKNFQSGNPTFLFIFIILCLVIFLSCLSCGYSCVFWYRYYYDFYMEQLADEQPKKDQHHEHRSVQCGQETVKDVRVLAHHSVQKRTQIYEQEKENNQYSDDIQIQSAYNHSRFIASDECCTSDKGCALDSNPRRSNRYITDEENDGDSFVTFLDRLGQMRYQRISQRQQPRKNSFKDSSGRLSTDYNSAYIRNNNCQSGCMNESHSVTSEEDVITSDTFIDHGQALEDADGTSVANHNSYVNRLHLRCSNCPNSTSALLQFSRKEGSGKGAPALKPQDGFPIKVAIDDAYKDTAVGADKKGCSKQAKDADLSTPEAEATSPTGMLQTQTRHFCFTFCCFYGCCMIRNIMKSIVRFRLRSLIKQYRQDVPPPHAAVTLVHRVMMTASVHKHINTLQRTPCEDFSCAVDNCTVDTKNQEPGSRRAAYLINYDFADQHHKEKNNRNSDVIKMNDDGAGSSNYCLDRGLTTNSPLGGIFSSDEFDQNDRRDLTQDKHTNTYINSTLADRHCAEYRTPLVSQMQMQPPGSSVICSTDAGDMNPIVPTHITEESGSFTALGISDPLAGRHSSIKQLNKETTTDADAPVALFWNSNNGSMNVSFHSHGSCHNQYTHTHESSVQHTESDHQRCPTAVGTAFGMNNGNCLTRGLTTNSPPGGIFGDDDDSPTDQYYTSHQRDAIHIFPHVRTIIGRDCIEQDAALPQRHSATLGSNSEHVYQNLSSNDAVGGKGVSCQHADERHQYISTKSENITADISGVARSHSDECSTPPHEPHTAVKKDFIHQYLDGIVDYQHTFDRASVGFGRIDGAENAFRRARGGAASSVLPPAAQP